MIYTSHFLISMPPWPARTPSQVFTRLTSSHHLRNIRYIKILARHFGLHEHKAEYAFHGYYATAIASLHFRDFDEIGRRQLSILIFLSTTLSFTSSSIYFQQLRRSRLCHYIDASPMILIERHCRIYLLFSSFHFAFIYFSILHFKIGRPNIMEL